jgi:glucosamine-6-phosphate deaminase
MNQSNEEIKQFEIGTMRVEIYPSRDAMGAAAAKATALALQKLEKTRETIGVIFATGASQLSTLEALTGIAGVPWDRIRGFHMDEYVGLSADHPASFRRYLRERLTEKVPLKEFDEVDGTAQDPQAFCREYAARLRSADPQLCLLGIGENGHLAFNDPAVADFEDPFDVKVVQLDDACRAQQVAEGWFQTPKDVPQSAITLTIPALFRVPKLIVSVPGGRKAHILRRVVEADIATDCPATILRTHPDATVFLDNESARELEGLL